MIIISTLQRSMLYKMLALICSQHTNSNYLLESFSINKITRAFLLLAALVSFSNIAISQDLPSPAPNNKILAAGSYVIAMDNVNQANSKNFFNLRAYGLVVYLLNNNVKVKWVIKAGKAKDGIDFTVNATKIKPSTATAASADFRAGPFVIQAADLSGVGALIDAYNNTISNAGDRVKVYQTNAVATIDERYDLTGFKPKAILLNNGGNWEIHREYLLNGGINFGMNSGQTEATNWNMGVAADLRNGCYTFASEAHYDAKNQADATGVTNDIRMFLNAGGNVLAECAAVRTYENAGLFHSSGGINPATENNFSGSLSTLIYPNPDLSFSQIEGNIDIDKGGSLKNWTYSGSLQNNEHDHVKGTGTTANIGASVAKLRSAGLGGLIFYLGNHNYDKIDQTEILNGIRMYLNAFLTPTANNAVVCGSAAPLAIPDFTPSNDIDALSFPTAGSARDFIVNISEILNAPSTGQVIFRLRKVSAFTITYNPTATSANVFGGRPVNNNDWIFTEDANFITLTLKPGLTINGFSFSSVGFTITRNAGIPINTTQNITSTILTGSGGDSNATNNVAVTSITAN